MKRLLLITALCAALCSSCRNDDTPAVPAPPVNPTFELVELDARTRNAIASQGNVFANKLMLYFA